MPTMRAKAKGGKDVVLQKKRVFLPLWAESSWKNYTTLSSEVHSIENEISKHLRSVLPLLEHLEVAHNRLEAEIKSVQADKWGNGEPFEMPTKEFVKLKVDVPRPTFDWKSMLSRTVLRMYHVDTEGASSIDGRSARKKKVQKRQQAVKDSANSGGATTVYTLDNIDNYGVNAEDLGADTALTFKEPQQNKQQNNRKKGNNQNNQNRNNRNQQRNND